MSFSSSCPLSAEQNCTWWQPQWGRGVAPDPHSLFSDHAQHPALGVVLLLFTLEHYRINNLKIPTT